MYKKILNAIKEYNTIIIHRHIKPDGDAIGSQIGLKEALITTFPTKHIFAVGDINDRYEFIGQMDEVTDDLYQGALVIVVDTPEEVMISDNRYKMGELIIKIDHHPNRFNFGNIEIVDTNYESCAGLIADILFSSGIKLNDKSARALFTGIVTDSGRFRYNSLKPKTFELAAKLIKYNFDFSNVYDNLYIEDFKIIKLRAAFVQKIQITDNNVAYIKTTKEELKEYGIDISTASRGMVNTMAGIKGVDIWVNFTEDTNTERIFSELRSRKHNVSEVAVKFGGGGHPNASGALLESFAVCDEMLAELDLMAGEKKDD